MKLYYQKRYLIKSYNNLQQRAFDKIEQEALVSQLLPTHVFYLFHFLFPWNIQIIKFLINILNYHILLLII
jgi:hypothetical protein